MLQVRVGKHSSCVFTINVAFVTVKLWASVICAHHCSKKKKKKRWCGAYCSETLDDGILFFQQVVSTEKTEGAPEYRLGRPECLRCWKKWKRCVQRLSVVFHPLKQRVASGETDGSPDVRQHPHSHAGSGGGKWKREGEEERGGATKRKSRQRPSHVKTGRRRQHQHQGRGREELLFHMNPAPIPPSDHQSLIQPAEDIWGTSILAPSETTWRSHLRTSRQFGVEPVGRKPPEKKPTVSLKGKEAELRVSPLQMSFTGFFPFFFFSPTKQKCHQSVKHSKCQRLNKG